MDFMNEYFGVSSFTSGELNSDVIPMACFPEGTEEQGVEYDVFAKEYRYVCSYKGSYYQYSVSKRVSDSMQTSQLLAMIKLKFEYMLKATAKKKSKLKLIKEKMLE